MNPDNGTVVLNGRSPGDTATYSCVSIDFDLVGTPVRDCGDDGQWSEEAPMCIRKSFHMQISMEGTIVYIRSGKAGWPDSHSGS